MKSYTYRMLDLNLPFILNWPCVCFFRQQLQSYYRPHHFYSLFCFSYSPRKRSKKPLLPNWPIKKVWKRVITHMALLPWTKPHGAFQFCFYRKNFFFLSAFSIVRGYNLLAPVQTCCVALQLWPASFILFTNSN